MKNKDLRQIFHDASSVAMVIVSDTLWSM